VYEKERELLFDNEDVGCVSSRVMVAKSCNDNKSQKAFEVVISDSKDDFEAYLRKSPILLTLL
jgi:hypothetical protein